MTKFNFAVLVAAVAVLLIGAADLSAQGSVGVCYKTITGVNQNRWVYTPINLECGPGHSPPWGNWGVTSSFGPKVDGDQWKGWHNTGSGGVGDWEWNSCTSEYYSPACVYFNAASCTEQFKADSVELGDIVTQVNKSCPKDNNSDGICDTGGCGSYDNDTITVTTPYLTVYELDGGGGNDDLVQTIYFDTVSVVADCDPWGCDQTWGTSWATPDYYADPSYAMTYTELKIGFRAEFSDDYGYCAELAEWDSDYDCN